MNIKEEEFKLYELLVLSRFFDYEDDVATRKKKTKKKKKWYFTKELDYIYKDNTNIGKILKRLIKKGVLIKKKNRKMLSKREKPKKSKGFYPFYRLKHSLKAYTYLSDLFLLRSGCLIQKFKDKKVIINFKDKDKKDFKENFLGSEYFKAIIRAFASKFNIIINKENDIYDYYDYLEFNDDTKFMDKQYTKFFRIYTEFALVILKMRKRQIINQQGFFDFLVDLKILGSSPTKEEIKKGHIIRYRRRMHSLRS